MFVKSSVTQLTQLLPVGNIFLVFSRNVGPIKVSLLSFWDRIKSTTSTMIGGSVMIAHPLVNPVVVSRLLTVMVLPPVPQTEALLRTKPSLLALLGLKLKTTRSANNQLPVSRVQTTTLKRTAHDRVFTFSKVGSTLKRLITNRAVYCFTSFKRFVGASSRTIFLETLTVLNAKNPLTGFANQIHSSWHKNVLKYTQ